MSCAAGVYSGPHALYDLPEVFDPGVGATITARAVPGTTANGATRPPTIKLAWGVAADPLPGAGAPVFNLQVSRDAGAWRDIALAPTYAAATPGHSYRFRARASDRIDDEGRQDWGGWGTSDTVSIQ